MTKIAWQMIGQRVSGYDALNGLTFLLKQMTAPSWRLLIQPQRLMQQKLPHWLVFG